jgi:hypothetical protein
MNKRQKKVVGFVLFVLILIILTIFNIQLTWNTFFILFYLFLTISVFAFEDDVKKILVSIIMLILIGLLVWIVVAYLFGVPFPYLAVGINEAVIPIFTIVLAVATISNVFVYYKIMNLSRLTNLDFEILDDLRIKVINVGAFPARNIKIETEFVDKSIPKKKVIKSIKTMSKDWINPQEKTVRFLSAGRHCPIDFTEYIKKRFKIKEDVNEYNELVGYLPTSKNKKVDFKMIVTVNFYSDTLSKNQIPIIKEVRFTADRKGSKLKPEL